MTSTRRPLTCAFALALWLTCAGTPASAANRLVNPDFATHLTGWGNPFFVPPLQRADWQGADGGPISGPGCLELGSMFNNGSLQGYHQDVPVAAGEEYALSGWSRLPASPHFTGAALYVAWLDAGNNVIGYSEISYSFEVGGGWFHHRITGIAPAGAVVARVSPFVATDVSTGSGESVVRWDDIFFAPHVFSDGFESGDFSGWSATSG
jgi:hypothetical protein